MADLSIFSTHHLHPEVTEALSGIGDYRVASAPTPEAILAESSGAEVIVVRAPIPVEVIEREQGLKALVRHGAGLDMIPVDAATQAGVLVANVPGVNALTVAEHVIWTALALLKRYPEVNTDLRERGWAAGRAHSDFGRELSRRTIGIVGMGNVGRAVHRMTQGFGLSVSATTRSTGNLPDGVAGAELVTLLETSDVVVLCCPLTPQTRGLISRERIAQMKPGALLVNVSRGAVVDEETLIEALRDGHLGGAALDVFADQPLDPQSPLFSFDNVILTPHMAGITEESMQRMGEGAAREALRVLSGGLPENLRNPEVVARYRERFPPG